MGIQDNTVKINELIAAINALPSSGGGVTVLQNKSVTPSESEQTVVPDIGYDGLSSVSVGAIPSEYIKPSGTLTITENGVHDVYNYANANVNLPTATQATPTISVSSNGLITASATQTAGLVSAGTKSATQQLTTKSATTYTPTTSDQTIASGTYLTGTQTVKGDTNLIASNIKKGISIFDVTGSYEGAGGGGGLPDGISAIATGTITTTEDEDNYVVITHNLGVIPNFVIWYVTNDYSEQVTATDANTALLGASIYKLAKYGPESSTVYNVHYWASGYNANPQIGYMGSRVANNNYMTTTTCWLKCNSTYMIKSGITYRWICGVTA